MRISRYLLPLLVIAAIFSGYLLRTAFTQPTTSVALAGTHKPGGKTLTCTVDGLKCKGTANFFTQLYANTAGINAVETFATEHRAIFTYDPALISADSIRHIMEAPIPLGDGSLRQVFVCTSLQ
jgi:hypothetical protein